MPDATPSATVEYDDEPITVCGQVIEFPHYAVPHDPKYANEGRLHKDGQPCNRDCDGQWPCVERLVQRDTLREIAGLLRSALYKRTGGNAYAEWTNPLGMRVRYGYGENDLWLQVLDSAGHVYAESLHVTAGWAANHV